MAAEITEIALIGCGNVGSRLASALSENGIRIRQIFVRDETKAADFASQFSAEKVNSPAEISTEFCLIAVSDSAINIVIQQLPKTTKIAYTSGSVRLEDINRKDNVGVFYPLQTFTEGRKVNLFEVPFLIEASDAILAQQLFDLAWKISRKVSFMNSEQREKIHLAAVFANNFVNHQLYIVEELAKQFSFDKTLLQPLLEETIEKAKEKGAFDAQTGPARRKDFSILEKQQQLLTNPQFLEIYKAISNSILETYETKL